MLDAFNSSLLWAAKYDLWGLISLIGVIVGAIYGYLKFFRPVKSIPNFTTSFNLQRCPDEEFELQLTIEFVNHTGRSAFITSVWFKCDRLRPDPNARDDAGSGKMEIKFPRIMQDGERAFVVLANFQHSLNDGESVGTYAPLDPSHSDAEVQQVMQCGEVGYLECFITLVSIHDKPVVYNLVVRPRKNYGIKLPRITRLGTFCRRVCRAILFRG